MSLSPRSLQSKAQFVEEPLTLPHAERDSVVFLQMVRQEQPIPKVLVVPQFPGRAPYLVSQPVVVRQGKPAGASRPSAFLQPSQAIREEAMNPVFHAPGRVAVQACRFIGAASVEDLKNDMQAMVISPFPGGRYLVLYGRNESLPIWNRNLSHWEHPLCILAPSIAGYSLMRNYLWRDI